jgi:hypothetical protein
VGPPAPARKGADGRVPLYRGTIKLVEVTAAASLEALRQRLMTHGPPMTAMLPRPMWGLPRRGDRPRIRLVSEPLQDLGFLYREFLVGEDSFVA